MLRFVVFPNLNIPAGQRPNPYIKDYIAALNQLPEVEVINPPHKNPLLSLLFPSCRKGDIFVFNWFESIPDFKYGMLQSIVATFFLLFLAVRGKKIIWMLHNKRPHAEGRSGLKSFLSRLIARQASLIVTHSTEGAKLIHKDFPYASGKVHFLHHPTKCRLPHSDSQAPEKKLYDLLIWGTIARYKGVFEFADFVKNNRISDLRICIIGGASDEVYQELLQRIPENITLIRERPSFDELALFISRSEFVLCPYSPDTVLSSGMLMDSLSFGAKVIGPDVGSFRDYASSNSGLNVYTFKYFEDIPQIVRQKREEPVSTDNYRRFLTENNWNFFAKSLIALLREEKEIK